MRICQKCGKEFAETPRPRKYCSDECRKCVKYERDRAWLAARPGKAAEYGRNWYKNNLELNRKDAKEAYRKKCMERLREDKPS